MSRLGNHMEAAHHARKAEREEDRAIRHLENGHVGMAIHCERKAQEDKFEAVVHSNHPIATAGAVYHAPVAGAAVGAAVVASELRHPHYHPPPPPVVVIPHPPAPGYGYPPAPGYGPYPPAYGYPPRY